MIYLYTLLKMIAAARIKNPAFSVLSVLSVLSILSVLFCAVMEIFFRVRPGAETMTQARHKTSSGAKQWQTSDKRTRSGVKRTTQS
jgi:hypothetical protein